MFTKIFPAIVLLAIAIGVLAELTFTRTKVYTIAAGPKESETNMITIRGKVTPIGANSFILRDPTGSAQLQTCPLWYKEINLTPGEEVTVTGEVLKEDTPAKGALYTLAVYKIERNHLPDIVLRTRPGKPPWTSSNYIPR